MASEAVPAAIDSLYEVPPAGFVQARNALVKSLKAAGQREEAAAAAKLSRPTASVWASNQVARRARDLIGQVADATARLQGGVTRDREKYAAAINHHRELLTQVRERVEAILADAGLRAAPATVAAAVQNFRTGLMDDRIRPLLRHGRLAEDVGLEAGAGLFGLTTAFTSDGDEAAPPPIPPKREAAPAHAAEAKAREHDRRQEDRERRERERALAKARAEAERQVHTLRKAAEAASAAREKQEFAVASARRELESAERKLVDAKASERQAAAALAAGETHVKRLARH